MEVSVAGAMQSPFFTREYQDKVYSIIKTEADTCLRPVLVEFVVILGELPCAQVDIERMSGVQLQGAAKQQATAEFFNAARDFLCSVEDGVASAQLALIHAFCQFRQAATQAEVLRRVVLALGLPLRYR